MAQPFHKQGRVTARRWRPARWAFLTALALLAACGERKPGPAAERPVEVRIHTVVLRDVPAEFRFVGQTQSSQQVEIRARVSGFLERRVYQEGAMVRAGDVLFRMDPKPFQAALAAAQAESNQQRARLATAQANLNRVRPLAAKAALSQKDLDDALGQRQAAAAALEQARANTALARLNLDYATVRSPVSGLSSYANKQEGSYIDPANSLLTYVAKLDPMWVNFSLSENEMLRLRSQTRSGAIRVPAQSQLDVGVQLADGSMFPSRGRISFEDAAFNTDTGTYLVRAELANPTGDLRPGEFVRVIVRGVVRTQAVTVPQQAVQQGPQGAFVWIAGPGDKAQQRAVETGGWAGDQWIIQSGLKAGDRVVVSNLLRLSPGAALSPSAAPTAAAGGARL